MPDIRLAGVTKRFGDFTAVKDLTIAFPENAVTCLLGPSGCGKTTLMRMIAGLETPSAGRIGFGDRDVTRLPPARRNIGMVFQYPVMYPTLGVAANIELPLRNGKLDAAERRRRVDEVLDVLDMADRRGARIDDLGSGDRQKVAVGRAVARHCDIVLFDEPTTNVEAHAKLQLIRAFKEVTRRLRQTIVYVTHDQTEAMTLADRIALMKDGAIVQFAPPRELYDAPTDAFGGWFLGNPGMTFLRRDVPAGANALDLPLLREPLPLPEGVSGAITVGVRPEHVEVREAAGPDTVAARVVRRALAVGGRYLLTLALGDETVRAKVDGPLGRRLGDTAHLRCRPERVRLFGADGRALG